MAEFPAMMLWTDAYLADTTHLRAEEHGAYLLLLMAAWRSKDGALADDDTFLARVCRCTLDRWRSRLRPIMEPFFTVADGQWTQKRLLKERAHLEDVRAKRVAAALAKNARTYLTARDNSSDANALKRNDTPSAHAGANGVQSTTTTTSKTPTPTVESKETVPTTVGTAAPPEASKAALWREMKAQIGGKDPGKIAGKWASKYGLPAVSEAHWAAMGNPPADYVSWMIARLDATAGNRPVPIQRQTNRRRGDPMEALRTNLALMDEDDDQHGEGRLEALSRMPVANALEL